MTINELRGIKEKFKEYYIVLENTFDFVGTLNKNQVANILNFDYESNTLKKSEVKSWLLNYCDILSNRKILDYYNFKKICDLIFLDINKQLDSEIGRELGSYCLKEILSCDEAIENDTICNDLKIILEKLEEINKLNVFSSKYRTLFKDEKIVYENLTTLASNPTSIKKSNHRKILKMISDVSGTKAQAIVKIQTSELLNEKEAEKIYELIIKKPDYVASDIADLALSGLAEFPLIFNHCISCIKNANNEKNIRTLCNICTLKSFQNIQTGRVKIDIINIIVKCNPDYLNLIESIYLDETYINIKDSILCLNMILSSKNYQEAEKNLNIASGKLNECDELDAVLYNAMMYVDENNKDENVEIPAEVLKMPVPKQISTNNKNNNN